MSTPILGAALAGLALAWAGFAAAQESAGAPAYTPIYTEPSSQSDYTPLYTEPSSLSDPSPVESNAVKPSRSEPLYTPHSPETNPAAVDTYVAEPSESYVTEHEAPQQEVRARPERERDFREPAADEQYADEDPDAPLRAPLRAERYEGEDPERPLPRVSERGERNCRNYRQDVVVEGESYAAQGTACQSADGSWRIVTAPRIPGAPPSNTPRTRVYGSARNERRYDTEPPARRARRYPNSGSRYGYDE